ncbi:serine/threonine-protein kinase [Planomonospora algeriensis]
MPGSDRLSANDPQRIGAYRLVGVLGEGGQGTVYLGQTASGRRVAVKVLHTRMAAEAGVRERFEREAALARRVAVFCTAQVLEAGVSDGRPYLVSEYVPGPSLQQLVTGEGPRTGSGLERLAVATATALAAIHRVGIVHRDFKPANVIMGPEGPVVIDFGIARILEAGVTSSALVGSPGYMAPEQLSDQPAGPPSDMFAWAATMVYAATGHPAFTGQHPAAVMNAVLNGEPDLNGVPEGLRPLLAACLAKNPGARPTAARVLAALTGDGTAPGAPGGVTPSDAHGPLSPPGASDRLPLSGGRRQVLLVPDAHRSRSAVPRLTGRLALVLAVAGVGVAAGVVLLVPFLSDAPSARTTALPSVPSSASPFAPFSAACSPGAR